ncbi:DUF998 domain-containing protein [Streptomyces sp. NBC_01767]|uniref:DUF998 domain-containing protein n=1 Tax=Streptomyces sp. NBC_01767 TaxID=2975937 RepID=UPI002250B0C3|nr:DUF998 domain-containing protein [Streptomyces sp. NBC_01767]MCX4396034.1 DUF998 domain-containing protein [Streptomyces sp. NBC_01767]
MTHTLGARTHEARSTDATRTTDAARTTGVPEVREAQRAPRTTQRGLLIGGMVAGPLFLGVATVQGLVREGFDFTRNAFSQLALGGPGWVQTINFVLTGALLLAGAFGLRGLLRGGAGERWVPVLIGVFGASFLAAAVFNADAGAGFPVGSPETGTLSGHGAAHMFSGMIGYLALCAAFVVLARPLAARGYRAWALASRLAPALVLAGFAASGSYVLAFTAGAGLGLCWLTAVTARLLAGTVTTEHPGRTQGDGDHLG